VLEAEMLDPTGASQPYRYTTRAMLKAVRDDYAATPRKAHKLKQMLSRLYSWADESSLVPEGLNPAAGFKRLETPGWRSSEYVAVVGSRARLDPRERHRRTSSRRCCSRSIPGSGARISSP
jgi:hypothetical protein